MCQALSRPGLRKSTVSPFRLAATTAPALVARRWLRRASPSAVDLLHTPAGRGDPRAVDEVDSRSSGDLAGHNMEVNDRILSRASRAIAGAKSSATPAPPAPRAAPARPDAGTADRARSRAKRPAHVRDSRRNTASAAGPLRRSGLCRSSSPRDCARHDSRDPDNRPRDRTRPSRGRGTLSRGRGVGGCHATSARQPVRRTSPKPASARWSAHTPARKTSA